MLFIIQILFALLAVGSTLLVNAISTGSDLTFIDTITLFTFYFVIDLKFGEKHESN